MVVVVGVVVGSGRVLVGWRRSPGGGGALPGDGGGGGGGGMADGEELHVE